MSRHNSYKYSYAFLYQSIAIYATTLALYLVVRALMAHGELIEVIYDPVVYLLCLIILLSAGALMYNFFMRRRIEVGTTSLTLKSAIRTFEIDKKDVKGVRIRTERSGRIMSSSKVITIFLKSRRRPVRVLPFNFDRSDELFAEIKSWAGDLASVRPQRKRPR